VGAVACLGKDVGEDKVQVERDVKEVALSVLANEARMARSDEKIRKARVTERFMETETCRAGLMDASTFKVRVHRLKQKVDVQREALALVTEECDSSSQLSDETAYDENEVVRTRAAERRQNPQLSFEQVVRKVSRGVITAAEGVGAMREVGVRVTQNFVKSAMRALSFGDTIPRLSECEDRRRRPSALSDAYSDQLEKIVKHYIRDGISLSRDTILSMAKNFYRDEHNTEPSHNTFGSAWFYRFLERAGIATSLYNPQDALRLNAATEHVSNFFERVARTSVSNGFATWNPDFDANDKSNEMIIWDEEKKSRVFKFDEARRFSSPMRKACAE